MYIGMAGYLMECECLSTKLTSFSDVIFYGVRIMSFKQG
ncbi:Uncharacterised protein [Yersinia kristensenii]|nr:Uncharacterised protein [Yersinia kristensenii]CNF31090.1 Uncharacterised protein [Yersinia kristensenii]CNH63772.1 Uncharacterised protein [Yersinia kristensenii]CNK90332.1 Uncharacterised protein [Yersinia kristensenii]